MPEPTWTEKQVVTKKAVPDGLWTQCPECEETIFRKSLEANLMVCPKCDHHMRVSARRRIEQLLDPGTFEPLDADMSPMDPLGFVDQKPYIDRIRETQRKSGEIDGVQTGTGFIKGRKLVVGIMDFISSKEMGNCTIASWKTPSKESFLFEGYFLLSAVAEKKPVSVAIQIAGIWIQSFRRVAQRAAWL